jgi:uncharacterized protein YbbK (DUF523 family)/uncharacterized protein YbgA (DUF1722 family)
MMASILSTIGQEQKGATHQVDVACDRPRIGISSCLLGQSVRYDGGHARSRFATGKLGPHVEWVSVCPEVETGMPVPREAIRLVGDARSPRLVGRSGNDYTRDMERWSARRLAELQELDLDGYVLKKNSPSCGLERVRVHADENTQNTRSAARSHRGTGLFAAALRAKLPALPLTEEGWLNDEVLREVFLTRVFTHHRLRTSLGGAPTRARIVEAHSAHKLLYFAHSAAGALALGRRVACPSESPRVEAARYVRAAMAVLAVPPSRGKHANALEHALGFFKRVLPASERAEALELIHEFRRGVHPLAVPLTMLVHHMRRHGAGDWLVRQVYFEPFPRAIATRFASAA